MVSSLVNLSQQQISSSLRNISRYLLLKIFHRNLHRRKLMRGNIRNNTAFKLFNWWNSIFIKAFIKTTGACRGGNYVPYKSPKKFYDDTSPEECKLLCCQDSSCTGYTLPSNGEQWCETYESIGSTGNGNSQYDCFWKGIINILEINRFQRFIVVWSTLSYWEQNLFISKKLVLMNWHLITEMDVAGHVMIGWRMKERALVI